MALFFCQRDRYFTKQILSSALGVPWGALGGGTPWGALGEVVWVVRVVRVEGLFKL